MQIARRHLLLGAAAGALRASDSLPPVRTITKGPAYHWFGYYDKLQFDPSSRYVLGMEVTFQHRSPRADDRIKIGMVDLHDSDRWIELGETLAWNWQQGCMLQWLPGSSSEIIWNDRQENRFVAHIMDVHTRKRRTLSAPIYALSPDARWAVACDFPRLNDTRPGYGYAGLADPHANDPAPGDAGIWKVDLATGKQSLLISFADAARIPYPPGFSKNAKHWFNHLLVSPDSKRFIFLHRWRGDGDRTFNTRLFTAGADGKDLFILDPHGQTSHFIWRDPQHVLAWAWHPSHGSKFYLYRDQTDQVEVVAPDVMTVNGHCTYLPGNRYILNDTYPDKNRYQHVYVYDTETGKRLPLGSFYSAPEFTGEWRCDTHPRCSPDGRLVCIDSPHVGNGRQMHLIEISGVVTTALHNPG